MVVDDAVVVRGLIARWIAEEPDFQMVAALCNGRQAVDKVEQTDPEVIILDVDMPELDGISALPRLIEKKPNVVIIMASTLTRRNAEISLKALSLGATDYLPKPESARELTNPAAFRRELTEKIRQLALRRRKRRTCDRSLQAGIDAATIHPSPPLAPSAAPPSFQLRPFSAALPKVLLVGSSTGGPQALTALVSRLGPMISRAPVLITQHMPPTFTTILAEHLARASNAPAREAIDGEPVVPGRIYLAPGGHHMRVVKRASGPAIALDEGPLINYCRPAVDPLFRTAADIWGGGSLGVILTGMGTDGAHGALDVATAGGSVIAQDEATSVIWGMPHAALQAGACAAVLPLDQIAPKIVRLFHGERS
jgi:two-component system, chemotaxis family, protein-glutamate methylesterase/glutaminase